MEIFFNKEIIDTNESLLKLANRINLSKEFIANHTGSRLIVVPNDSLYKMYKGWLKQNHFAIELNNFQKLEVKTNYFGLSMTILTLLMILMGITTQVFIFTGQIKGYFSAIPFFIMPLILIYFIKKIGNRNKTKLLKILKL